MTPSSDKPKTINKLVVRNKVLAVMQYLNTHPHLTPSERLAQYRKLESLNALTALQDIVFKELERARDPDTLHSACELLMHFGQIEALQKPLWDLITNKAVHDETKDAANLILRHLGDASDPNAYLEYLKDPEGLINRETDRMLQTAMTHPQALVDLIDFIISLRPEHQEELLETLCEDYKAHELLNLYIPLLESQPNEKISQFVIDRLADSQSAEALTLLLQLQNWPTTQLPCPQKHLERAIKKLQLSGVTTSNNYPNETPPSLLLKFTGLETTVPGQCYLTLYDGLGNQGLLFSRQHVDDKEGAQPDVAILGIALNDKYGIVDCFGFERLTPPEWNRLIERFHDTGLKIPISAEFAAFKLKQAEQLNIHQHRRLPYEYRVWETLLHGINLKPLDLDATCRTLYKQERCDYTGHLYEHPDFSHWFVEFGDEESSSEPLQGLFQWTTMLLEQDTTWSEETIKSYEEIALNIITALWQEPEGQWKRRIVHRLAECAYLLQQQETLTFATLAASEALFLKNNIDNSNLVLSSFLISYGRKTVIENLLRLQNYGFSKNSSETKAERIQQLVQLLKTTWKL